MIELNSIRRFKNNGSISNKEANQVYFTCRSSKQARNNNPSHHITSIMPSALVVDNVLPALTARFLALREDEEEKEDCCSNRDEEEKCLPTDLFLEDTVSAEPPHSNNNSKQHDATTTRTAMVVSPCQSSGTNVPLWSSFDTGMLPPPPSTPLSAKEFEFANHQHHEAAAAAHTCANANGVNLLASFYSSPTAELNLWHRSPLPSQQQQRTIDAFCSGTEAAVWMSPGEPKGRVSAAVPATGTGNGNAVLLMPDHCHHPAPQQQQPQHRHHHAEGDGLPTMIRWGKLSICSTLSSGSGIGFGDRYCGVTPDIVAIAAAAANDLDCDFDLDCGLDDEVSLLADDPDDDDADLLPHATYDVLANLFDEF